MADRWRLNRAGIVNVYQYDDETLHFAGGRLLLRGVNGSGKSTAMSMLLPFLLEADTRRIDAAGEQSGVLRSWMLTGRDEPQPVGYLWIELARGEDRLTCGCGIRASRSADTVSTWWFVTSRRPGQDLDLVEGRRPLSQEALRAALAPEPVFRHDQRQAYRQEVRQRLYGGAEIDQHLRLLHVVRSPRVGDRIDLDLPEYLQAALPQLSEVALDDAAQPLDDLEEHRRNVAELSRTADALGALAAVYESYARDELRRRAAGAIEQAGEAERARRAAVAADEATEAAERHVRQVEQQLALLEADERRLRIELEALRSSPAYQAGAELNELRDHVRTLTQALQEAGERVQRAVQASARQLEALQSAAAATAERRSALLDTLGELAALALAGGLSAPAPDVPPLVLAPLVLAPVEGAPAGAAEAPGEELELAPTRAALGELRAAVAHREGDVGELRAELRLAEEAERRLAAAGRALEAARAELERRRLSLADARAELDEALRSWRQQLSGWLAQLQQHRSGAGLPEVTAPNLESDLAARREQVAAVLATAASETLEAHLRRRAGLVERRRLDEQVVDELAAELAELEARELPPPPALAWQRPERPVVLAELVDFAPSLSAEERSGLEAAMEAAGLLGAEVAGDGSLVLDEGRLVLGPGAPAASPLGSLLAVTVPDVHAGRIDPAAVAAVLGSISTDPALLAPIPAHPSDDDPALLAPIPAHPSGDDPASGEATATVVTLDGRFRSGLLAGRHAKAEAEHVGVTARRAVLARQRAEARSRLERAQATLSATGAEVEQADRLVAEAESLRAALPGLRQLDEALARFHVAETDLERGAAQHEEQRAADRRAEEEHAEAVDKSRRTAANLDLPVDAEGLAGVERVLSDARAAVPVAEERLGSLGLAVTTWLRAAAELRRVTTEERLAGAERDAAADRHEPMAARLATLEDSVGAEYEEVAQAAEACARELKRTETLLGSSRSELLAGSSQAARAAEQAGTARAEHAERVALARAGLPRLRRALAVPGLLAAALGTVQAGPAAEITAPVEDSPDGLRALAATILSGVAAPERGGLGADGVRLSLRQRRDSLGSGWDAEDRQPDEALPLFVEVTGPEGQLPLAAAVAAVATRRRELAALLSSEQDEALRNLLQGLVAVEVADKLHAASELVRLMNRRLDTVRTADGIGVSLRWRRRHDLDAGLSQMVELLAKPPDLRTPEQDEQLRGALAARLDEARAEEPEAPYRELIGRVLDYRAWHEMHVLLRRPGLGEERLTRRSALSEGEKKIVSYLPLFAAVAASCDALAESAPDAPRFVLLDDAFAKVSEDNHPKLFGLLVELDLDFIATSERLWGTHSSVPELAITEVLRDADLGVIVLEHSRWDGKALHAGDVAAQP